MSLAPYSTPCSGPSSGGSGCSMMWAHAWISGSLPTFIEKSSIENFAGESLIRRNAGIDNRPVRQFRRLARVRKIVGFAEGEAAVEHHVPLRVVRIRVDHYQRLRSFGWPALGQLIGDPRENPVTAWIAPQDQVVVGDLRVGDVTIVANLSVAAE